MVIFVLGGPGSGKGTQCAKLAQEYGFKHVSPGALLREEQSKPGSSFGDIIKSYMKDGRVMPGNLTIELLEHRMHSLIKDGIRKFVMDGFPRTLDQTLLFEQRIAPSKLAIFLDCSEEAMTARLLDRGMTSGRLDDNEESIKKRMRTFVATSMPVVELLRRERRAVTIDAAKHPTDVYQDIREILNGADLEASEMGYGPNDAARSPALQELS